MAARVVASVLASATRRASSRAATPLSLPRLARLSNTPLSRPLPFTLFSRAYSAPAGLSKEDITARIVDVLKSFEKVEATKLTPASSFAEDLGLDSLDAVEVVMAIEEEFAIEIPDAEADEIKTVDQAIDYISKTPEAH